MLLLYFIFCKAFLLPIFDKLYIPTISKILDKQIRLVFAILLVLHSIGQTYLALYFRPFLTSFWMAQLVKVSVW